MVAANCLDPASIRTICWLSSLVHAGVRLFEVLQSKWRSPLEAPGHGAQSPEYAASPDLLSCHLQVPEGLIDLAGHPQTVEQNSQLSCDGDDSSLLRRLATIRIFQAPAAQI